MAKRGRLDINAMRKKSGMNQTDFWARFGVTQSGGSRYESGRDMPKSLHMLIELHRTGKISEADLESARKAVA